MRRTITSLTLVLSALIPLTDVRACPLCKFALETNENEPKAYMFSILFMMGMISALFAGVTALLYWISKLEKKKLTEAGYEHLFENAGSQPHLSNVKETTSLTAAP